VEAFGFHRLGILQCLDALVHLNFDAIMAELIKFDNLFIYLFNLFFTFPSNNFCHKFVERIFLIILTYLNNQPLTEVWTY
jgi:hypothetical protein